MEADVVLPTVDFGGGGRATGPGVADEQGTDSLDAYSQTLTGGCAVDRDGIFASHRPSVSRSRAPGDRSRPSDV